MPQKQAIIDELLTRGVEKIIVKEHLKKRLLANEKLTLKLGIDPTGSDIHIGHMVVIRKLREFQKLGHKIVIIVGDYTARIGDPTGRDKMRQPLTKEEIYKNLKTFQEQICKVLDLKKTKFAYQSEWFDKMNLEKVLKLAGIFTVQQMVDREMYQSRLKEGAPIGLHEFLYPLAQGYDSVAIKADVEFGGSDQEFNLLAGRPIQEHFGQKPQDIFTTKLLLGLDGRKMSKTYNNYIGVLDKPNDMYGKVMSAIDDILIEYFIIATDVNLEEIKEIERALKKGSVNPREAKARLAREIVTMYHDKKSAEKAEKEFNEIFKDKGIPSSIPVYKTSQSKSLIDVFVESRIVKSKGEARRLFGQNGLGLLLKDGDNVERACIKDLSGSLGGIVGRADKEIILTRGKRVFVKILFSA